MRLRGKFITIIICIVIPTPTQLCVVLLGSFMSFDSDEGSSPYLVEHVRRKGVDT